MQISDKRAVSRWVIIAVSFFIVVFILVNTYYLFRIFKEEEHNKVELWVMATQTIIANAGDMENTPDKDAGSALLLAQKIQSSNTTVPTILVTADGQVSSYLNIDDAIMKDPKKAKELVEEFKSANKPLVVQYVPGQFQYIYYSNSSLLNKLKYYPIAIAVIIILFGGIVYNFYRATKSGAQNRLWAGMAKETAHQIGTPLSSLLGWIEIMRADNVDETTVEEVEKDVLRLQTIAERFSKIGSEPLLKERDIVAETEKSFQYLKSRASKQIDFFFKAPSYPVMVMLNPELHSWTIENLVKNAIDAMKGKGSLQIVIDETERHVKIKVTDSGKGIPKAQYRKVFEPGFTTKKRGWGLGLSLTRRIVEEYHKGRIKVLQSEIGKGTTMQASFRKIE
jgi:protein-S-isoprenylcysteine O-methyltransferase Ste14